MKFDLVGIFPPASGDTAQGKWQRAITAAVLLSFTTNVALGAAMFQTRKVNESAMLQLLDLIGKAAERAEADSTLMLTRLDQSEARTVGVTLLMLRTRYCLAVAENRIADAQQWLALITDARVEYSALSAGRAFPPFEPCP